MVDIVRSSTTGPAADAKIVSAGKQVIESTRELTAGSGFLGNKPEEAAQPTSIRLLAVLPVLIVVCNKILLSMRKNPCRTDKN